MFITLEGIEGSGKTSQVQAIARWLAAAGYTVQTTREPGGTAIGGQIRSVLLNPQNDALAPGAELLLYMADRVQHVETVVRPALAAGKVVVCDRFFDATMVYQGYARGLDRETIRRLHRLTCGGMTPDLTLLDAVVTSLRLEPNGVLGGKALSLLLVTPPMHLVY